MGTNVLLKCLSCIWPTSKSILHWPAAGELFQLLLLTVTNAFCFQTRNSQREDALKRVKSVCKILGTHPGHTLSAVDTHLSYQLPSGCSYRSLKTRYTAADNKSQTERATERDQVTFPLYAGCADRVVWFVYARTRNPLSCSYCYQEYLCCLISLSATREGKTGIWLFFQQESLRGFKQDVLLNRNCGKSMAWR